MSLPIVLSDLDVRRKQVGKAAIYFDRYSAESLADALGAFVPLSELQRELQVGAVREAILQRVVQFAQDFVGLAGHCQPESGCP